MTKQQARLRVRLYARLSKDDGDADKESNSITTSCKCSDIIQRKKDLKSLTSM